MKSLTLLSLLPAVLAFPRNPILTRRDDPTPTTTEVQDGQTGTLIAIPPQPTETGLKQIPDADHPFIAPGPDDQRGPAMNTLANHGYIPRNGVASFEQITVAVMEAFNLDFTMGANMAATNMLTRGNPFIDLVSIGGVSPLVPPLPGQIDGVVTGGIAKHGRFEGDASMTRADAFIGDNRDFQDLLYDLDLLQLGKFGDDGPDGPSTVFNVETLIGMKKQNIMMDQAANPMFEFAARRMNGAYLQMVQGLNLRHHQASDSSYHRLVISLPLCVSLKFKEKKTGSFFRNQTFPQNWFRAASPVTGANTGAIQAQIMAAIPTQPGRNNDQGIYVADPLPPAPFNSSFGCFAYYDQAANTPGVLVNTTGIFQDNVQLLAGIQFQAAAANPGCTQPILPFGPARV
ncbi:Chloroperoxidase [Mycena metata]|uniref:Chloroperoxidase n=1 Tax=Mycena metata TaxID=1033252 RepID=A0AAD7HUU7_9AGAR|nr:Chloroperoxidase [Mycena metata]